MKKFIVVLVLLSGSAFGATEYFGAHSQQVHTSLHPSKNVLEDTLKAIGTNIAESPNWSGTPLQAHDLVRRTVITKHGLKIKEDADLDAEPLPSDMLVSSLRDKLLNIGYDEIEVDALMVSFKSMTHPQD